MTIYCERCNKPVDSLEISLDPILNAVQVTVCCHGATQSIFIPKQSFVDYSNLTEAEEAWLAIVRGDIDGLAFSSKLPLSLMAERRNLTP